MTNLPIPMDIMHAIYSAKNHQEASFIALDHIDRLLCDGKFDEVDNLIAHLDPRYLASPTQRIILVATHLDKEKFAHRAAFLEACRGLLAIAHGIEEADRRLRRLE